MTTILLFNVVMSAFIYQGQGVVNFAFHKSANQSSTLSYGGFEWTADKAVDGNIDGSDPENIRTCTCSATIATTSFANPTWEVDIGFQIIVTTITVYGRTDTENQLDGVRLYLGNNPGPWNYSQAFSKDPSSVTQLSRYVFKLDNIIARFISLERVGKILTICEVNVEGTVNFALHKSAVESTTLNYNNFNWTADKAVDGISDGSDPDHSMTCSSTKHSGSVSVNNNWEVDIGFQIIVKTITVYGRSDGNNDNLSGVKLFIGNVSMPWRYNQDIPSTSSSRTKYVFKPNNAIASVISLMRYAVILVICEVTVEGECLDGNFSEFCNLTCGKCYAGQPCNKENGTCPLGCDQGWKGTLCKEGCKKGNYGYNCNETCGNCLYGNDSCSTSDGNCTKGCIAGWQGYRCHKGCERGNYGYNCNETCGHCLYGNDSCSTSDGNCTKGCIAGWQGYRCQKGCVTGTYGYHCNDSCGNCLNGNNNCSTINGSCRMGCNAGWQGDDCKKGCDTGTYFYNCNETCGNCLNGNNSCDTSYGHCNNGCKAGWQGDNCRTKCDAGTYGLICNETCGYCLNGNNSCSNMNGQCSGGCQAGWTGDTCKSECDAGTYGLTCNTTCGYCLNGNNSCLHTYGQCRGGCQTGWKGETCKSECEAGTYGFHCNETCGYCLNGNNSCLHTYGQCRDGCQTGWKGETCKSGFQTLEQTSIDAGLIGGSAGSAIAVVALIVTIVVIIVVRRRRKTPLSCPSTGNELSNKKDDAIVYENPSFLNIQPGTGTKATTSTATQKDGDRGIKLTNQDSETYYNLGDELQKGSIPLSSLWDYVQEHFLDDTYFSEEFETLPSGPQLPITVALRSENRNKNRYKQLYPYDMNRVLLNPMSNDDSDYINASFIDGYSGRKMYIASQGTTKDNIDDFWRMLWQYDVEKIVMLTGLFEGGKHKCELYWPVEKGQRSSFGSVSVRLLDTDVFADYDMRILEMTVSNKSKRLTQFHYTAWPDKGVPKAASSIVQFWRSVNRVPTNKPLVVHCSAGIGRTGTYLALDYLANQAKVEGLVNVLACVSNLRRQRVNLVQTKEQYIFLHETLVEALMLSGTATTSENFPQVYNELMKVDREIGKIKLQLEYERMQDEVANHENVYASIKMEEEDGEESESKQDEYSAAKKFENRAKNRHKNILPADRHRVYLSTHVSGRNDYINAVIVPSHRQKMGFILTQMPLTDTIIDFWRMINDHEIRTILMFNSGSSKTCDIGIYWPTDGEVRFGQFSIRLTNQERHKNYLERTLSFSVIGDKATRSIKQFQFTKWTETADIPGNIESFLHLIDAVDKWQKEREAKPVVVHCINGAERSGLYCVISTVIERLNVERDVAITQTIKRIRAIRQQIIPNYEQFQFCHECILQYIKMFETYSNF